MKGGSNDTSKCTLQAKHSRKGKVVFANLPRLGYSLAYGAIICCVNRVNKKIKNPE